MRAEALGSSSRALAWLFPASVLFGVSLQLHWALNHSFDRFALRAAVTVIVLTALATAVYATLRRRIRSRPGSKAVLAAGLRFALGISPLPVALLFANPYSGILVGTLVASFAVAFAFRSADPAAAPSRNTIAAQGVVVLVAWIAIGLAPPHVDGLTVHLVQARSNDYYTLQLEDPIAARAYSDGTYRSENPNGTAIRFRLPTPGPALLHPVLKLGVRHADHLIAGLSFDSIVLFWHVPLVRPALSELGEMVRGMPHWSTVTYTPAGLAVHSQTGPGPRLLLTVDRARLADSVDVRYVWLVKFAWLVATLAAVVVITQLWGSALPRTKWTEIAGYLFTGSDSGFDYAAFFRANRWWLVGGVVILLAALFLRSFDNIAHPGLYVEDSTHYFNKYYGGDVGFDKIFEKPNFYIAFGTNFYAWAVAKLDVRWQPMLYLLIALGLATVASSFPAFTGLIRNRSLLLLTPTLLGLSGMVHIYMWITLTYQIFVGVVLLLSILIAPPPRTLAGNIIAVLAITVCIWSGAYSVLAVPVSILLLVLRVYPAKAKTTTLVYTIVCALFYYLTLRGGTTDLLMLAREPFVRQHFLATLFEQIYFLGLLGTINATKVLALITVLLVVFYILRKDRVYIKISLILISITVLSLFLYFSTIKYMPLQIWTNHTHVSYFFWLLFLIYTVDNLFRRIAFKTTHAVAASVVAVSFIAYDNILHPAKRSVPVMRDVTGFVDAVKHYERYADELKASNRFIILETRSYWRDEDAGPRPTAVIGSRRPNSIGVGPRALKDSYGLGYFQARRVAD